MGGVAHLATEFGKSVAAIVGHVHPSAVECDDYRLLNGGVLDLESRFGADRSYNETRTCIEAVARELLSSRRG